MDNFFMNKRKNNNNQMAKNICCMFRFSPIGSDQSATAMKKKKKEKR